MLEGIGSVIRHGISRQTNQLRRVQDFGVRVASLAVVVLTLGFNWDTQYPQYAFRVRLK